jgi:hypothetical protein
MNYLNRCIPRRDFLWPHRVTQNVDGMWLVNHALLGRPTVFGRYGSLEVAVCHARALNEQAWSKNEDCQLETTERHSLQSLLLA